MFSATSRECQSLFSAAPPKILDEWPETVVQFLEWLLPKERVLAKLAAEDCELQDLRSAASQIGPRSLASRRDCVLRHIDYILLKRGLFSFYSTLVNLYIAARTELQSLVDRASKLILSTACDDKTLELLQVAQSRVLSAWPLRVLFGAPAICSGDQV